LIEKSSLDLNPLHQSPLYDFCLFPVSVEWQQMSDLWLYCYFWPQQSIGYGFTWNDNSKNQKQLSSKNLKHL
jgi:hypothetical protein